MFKWYYYHFLNFLLISELHKSSRDFHLQVSLRIPCVSSYGSTFKRVISNEDSILLWSMVNIASNWFVLQTEEKRFSKCLYWPPGGKLCPKFFDALIHLISFIFLIDYEVIAFCSQFLITLVFVSAGILVHLVACCFLALSLRILAMLFMISFTFWKIEVFRYRD